MKNSARVRARSATSILHSAFCILHSSVAHSLALLLFDLPARILRHPHAVDPALVGAIHFEQPAVLCHDRAYFRDAAERGEDHAGDGLVILAAEVGVEHLFERIDAQETADQKTSVAEVDDGRFFVLVLVGDFADDLLDDVLDGNDAGGAAVFIDDHRDLQMLALKFAQQVAHLLRFRNEVRRPGQIGNGEMLAFEYGVEELLDVHDAADLIDRFGVDGDARVLRFAEHAREVVERPVRVECLHVDARRHQLLRHTIAEVDDRLQQLPFRGLEDSFFLADVDVRLQLFVGDFFVVLFFRDFALALQALEELPQRREHRPERVVEKMGQRNHLPQQQLAHILGDEREDELPDHHDEDPDERGDERGIDDGAIDFEREHGCAVREHERDLQQRAGDELGIALVVDLPAAPLLAFARQAAQRDGTDLQGERAESVEDQVEESAKRGEDNPDRYGATTSHVDMWRILAQKECHNCGSEPGLHQRFRAFVKPRKTW